MNETEVTQAIVLFKALADGAKSVWGIVSARRMTGMIPVYNLVTRAEKFDRGTLDDVACAGSKR